LTDPVPSILTFLRTALGERIDPAATTFLAMMAEGGVMEFPYARPGMPTRVEGRDEIAAYMSAISGNISLDTVSDLVVHQSVDPEVVILEFNGSGHAVKTGEPYEQRYISVIGIRDGRIVHYKDYWNPIEGLKASLGSAAVEAFLAGEPRKA